MQQPQRVSDRTPSHPDTQFAEFKREAGAGYREPSGRCTAADRQGSRARAPGHAPPPQGPSARSPQCMRAALAWHWSNESMYIWQLPMSDLFSRRQRVKSRWYASQCGAEAGAAAAAAGAAGAAAAGCSELEPPVIAPTAAPTARWAIAEPVPKAKP